MTVKRSANDLVKPTVHKDALWEIVRRAGRTTPVYSRADMQEPFYTMILTAFFAVICYVLAALFPALVLLLIVLLALVMAWFGYEWHTWVFMRRMNRAVEDAAQVEAYERTMKLLRASQNIKAKQAQRKQPNSSPIRSLWKS
jgi:ABC-type bacteriocin/lantibiotic exporter with double-glycine peptidase domain